MLTDGTGRVAEPGPEVRRAERAPAPRLAAAPVPDRQTGADALPERLVELVYRTACGAGCSPQEAERLCLRVLPQWLGDPPPPSSGPAAGRRTRARVAAAVRVELAPRTDPATLERALADAVLADELALLPPRQQQVLRWIVQQGWTVTQVSDRTGWTSGQVALLMRAGLATLTVRGRN